MTDADKPAFAQAITLLAVTLKEPELDAMRIRQYFTALSDRPIEFVTEAVEQILRSSSWFPKPAEWLEATFTLEKQRRDTMRAHLRKLPAPLCVACNDTGWARNEEANSVARCDCQELRRLEILGRRPLPLLPAETR